MGGGSACNDVAIRCQSLRHDVPEVICEAAAAETTRSQDDVVQVATLCGAEGECRGRACGCAGGRGGTC